MTDPTGRCFLSYRRLRSDEAALLLAAQHDHGIPTWQDTQNLGSVPTEDEIRRTLADTSTASALLFITPEVEDSPIIRNVEIPKIIQRSEADDSFFVVPLAAGGLDYAKAADVSSNHLSAQNLPTGICIRSPLRPFLRTMRRRSLGVSSPRGCKLSIVILLRVSVCALAFSSAGRLPSSLARH